MAKRADEVIQSEAWGYLVNARMFLDDYEGARDAGHDSVALGKLAVVVRLLLEFEEKQHGVP